MAAPVVPGLIVNELLDKDNYYDWQVLVRTYLQAKGLWSVIEEATGPPKGKDKREDWKKRNAEALHAILLCCGKDAFSVIRFKAYAYEAWDALRSRSFEHSGFTDAQSTIELEEEKKDDKTENEILEMEATKGDLQRYHDAQAKEVGEANELKEAGEGDLQRDHDAQAKEVGEANELKEADEGDGDKNSGNDVVDVDYELFFRDAKHSKWDSVMDFINKHPEAVTKTYLKDDEKTVLHYAVEDMNVKIIQQLMPLIKDEDELDIWDSECNTALEYCYMLPDTDEMVEIAKCLVQKKKELNADGSGYPYRSILLEAFMKGRPKLANYLFKVTHFKTDDRLAAQLISLSFSTKRFDIASKLIERNPSLAIAKDFSGNSPLNELACTPSAFLSGSRLQFWEKWIYHAISIKSTVKSGEGRPNKGDVPTGEANVKGKPTPKPHAVSGEGKGKCAQAHHIVIDIWTSKVDKGKKFGLIRSVTAIFQGPIIEKMKMKICRFLGIYYIHEIIKMKVNHTRVHEILVCMCQELTTEKQKGGWDEKQTEFVEAAMFQAAERGLVEFLIEILKVNPKLATISNKKGQNLFQVAVEYRQAEVFNLIHGFNKDKRKAYMSEKDDDDNNMLHMMGISSPSSQTNRIRGAALQMQNELLWFKELERMASPEDLEAENDTLDMTPREFFSKNHTDMVKEGEKSMKGTATSCTVVGALMVTMMFAAAFTLPNPLEDNSSPPLPHRRAFKVFIIADTISLFTSTTSVVLFLGILTSRYAEEDFLKSLPRKMILGLLTLFLSVAAMVIVFASALFVILPSDTWIALPTTLLAGIPIASFIWMQFPFLVEIFYSTYIRRLFDKKVHVKLNVGKVR